MILAAIASNRKVNRRSYVQIPAAPTFSDFHTLVQGTTGVGLVVGETGGKFDLVIGSDYDLLQLQGLTGTYRMKSDGTDDPATWRTIGGLTRDYSISMITSVPTLELYNLFLSFSDNILKMSVANPASIFKLRTLFFKESGFAAAQANESVSGKNYTDVEMSFCASKDSGGEFIYWGHTVGGSLSDFLGETKISHNCSQRAGREGIQLNNHESINVHHNTCLNGGQDIANSGIGQSLCFQLQGIGGGSFHHNILTAKGPGMIASTGLHFHDNFIGWTQTDREIYIQDISANGYHFEVVGDTFIIEDNIFYCPNFALGWVIRLQEENMNVIIRNNIFPAGFNDSTVVKDERLSTPYSLTITGNTYTDTPYVPTMVNHPDPKYSAWFKVVHDSYFYGRHMGALTP